MRSRISAASLLAVFVAASAGCADFHRGAAVDGGRADDALTAGEDPVFEKSVYPILKSRCQNCHSVGGGASSTRYVLTGNAGEDRARVMDLVAPGNPDASVLLRRAGGESHSGGQVLSSDGTEYQTVADWIRGLPAE